MQRLFDFIKEQESTSQLSKAALLSFFERLGELANSLHKSIGKAGLLDILGTENSSNVSGDQQHKLDLVADRLVRDTFEASPEICGMASEENEDFITFENAGPEADLVLITDPLDGSSNIDVNVSIGTIFTLYQRKSSGKPNLNDFLQAGNNQILAGYLLYGTSTMLVFSNGHGVNGFTLDPEQGEFYLSHPQLSMPSSGRIYSINEGNREGFAPGLNKYLDWCQQADPGTQRPYSARYIGSMVADFHRNLLKGGIFIYPGNKSNPEGKLRLLYECNPMAFLAEQAGGKASDGKTRILDLIPDSLHQRTPVYIGSSDMVDQVESFIQQKESV